MRDPRRIEGVVQELKAAWLANPDWRLGQLIVNVTRSRDPLNGDPFNVEDEDMAAALRALWAPHSKTAATIQTLEGRNL